MTFPHPNADLDALYKLLEETFEQAVKERQHYKLECRRLRQELEAAHQTIAELRHDRSRRD